MASLGSISVRSNSGLILFNQTAQQIEESLASGSSRESISGLFQKLRERMLQVPLNFISTCGQRHDSLYNRAGLANVSQPGQVARRVLPASPPVVQSPLPIGEAIAQFRETLRTVLRMGDDYDQDFLQLTALLQNGPVDDVLNLNQFISLLPTMHGFRGSTLPLIAVALVRGFAPNEEYFEKVKILMRSLNLLPGNTMAFNWHLIMNLQHSWITIPRERQNCAKLGKLIIQQELIKKISDWDARQGNGEEFIHLWLRVASELRLSTYGISSLFPLSAEREIALDQAARKCKREVLEPLYYIEGVVPLLLRFRFWNECIEAAFPGDFAAQNTNTQAKWVAMLEEKTREIFLGEGFLPVSSNAFAQQLQRWEQAEREQDDDALNAQRELIRAPASRPTRVSSVDDQGSDASSQAQLHPRSAEADSVDGSSEDSRSTGNSQYGRTRRPPQAGVQDEERDPSEASFQSVVQDVSAFTPAERAYFEQVQLVTANMTAQERHDYDRICRFFLEDHASVRDGNRELTLDQVRALPPQDLERIHTFIQLLFPLEGPASSNNPEAPLLTPQIIRALSLSPRFLMQLETNATVMADFWGLSFDSATRTYSQAPNSLQEFTNLMTHPHNFLRITRMLKCLIYFGKRDIANAFYTALVARIEASGYREHAAFIYSKGVWGRALR